ncbi:SIS domain-containing protein [Nocardioides jensenii]|uniref:SIS domain-containing protein n=1 Tax=Nocardioides jensenii TaxID=1843 RepID=UPI00082B9A8B|nr:SIS domain-containing protein [Nocardioides jensenii]
MWFDESRLDDESALAGSDLLLRSLAESGARVRRAASDAADAITEAVGRSQDSRPRAVIAAGPDSRLLRAVLEPWCPVPFVAWPGAALPGWTGSLDLVVILAPERSDPAAASAVAEAVRRGCQVVVACQADSMVADHAAGRWATVLPIQSGDQLATAVVMLDYLHQIGLGPASDADEVAEALDAVAIADSPHRDLAVNPAKVLAISLADANPLVWGGSVLAARAARRVAESIRRASGRSALAGDAEHLLPVLEATRARDVFDDPFADDSGDLRTVLLVLDDGADDPVGREQLTRLRSAADSRGVRVETVEVGNGSEVARYASLILSGRYAAAYLQLGLVDD